MQDDKLHCGEAWLAAGSAVEFALKAFIMRRNRMNSWPTLQERKELHTHDLLTLMVAAGLDRRRLPSELRVPWKIVLDWDHTRQYDARNMPRKVARDMVQAALGANGVVEWLKSL